ncbi:hypothetical protein G6O67_004036 [Ophiocordyceps sinensis]|uniref:Telomere-associated protein Rif1 N-terminal domain-containing protein n=2 Tax=Ophiocordyceps sinensis TaxID=72228 RepID=A0A8H4LZC4_9HYPO|nr:hypothetical protein G6O67_004036 [Ophiocordyceps sinensis]
MASLAGPAPSIHILTARPPTPPREASHDVNVSLRSVVLGRSQSFDPCRSLQTPPGVHSSISSVATGSNPSSGRVRKRVEWSSHTDYKDPPDYRDGARLDKSHLLSTPSSASSRPVKGILKPSPSPNLLASSLATELHGTVTQPNLIEMLDSSIKQLAGPDRDSKLDAYMMLARALKTSNNLPDRVALQNKMSLFMQFIQRDITSKNDNGALDSSLANHALTLLATFLHFQAIASTLTSDFGISIIDHAIRSFQDPAIPKDIVRHLMQVVAFQNFSPKIMAPDRVGRLVAALHKVEDHVQGKSIVMSRLHIYRRLVKQARNSMLAHSDWLKDMFTDMLSTVKDIQAQAISLGTEAGFALRPDKLLFRKAADIFAATDDDESYIDFYIKRLQRMVKDKQTSPVVPQIWSVVILFLRCPFDRWEYYAPWLRLVQDAFNMTDGPTKQEANYAWNRYVCLSILDTKMSPKAINTLCKPLLSQLRRKANPKQHDEAMKLRRIVLGGVCSLYYYAFAQGDDKCPTEVTWDVAVQPVMAQLIDLDGKPDVPGDCMMHAAHMLAGLLDASTPRPPRDPDRIMDTAPLKPEELLPIDCKWVRRNCDKVFQAVEPILEKKFVDLANKDSLVYRLWQALVGSVAAASAKDIKVSEDTTKFLACSLSLLARVWSRGVGEDDGSANAKFLSSVTHFVQVLVDGLGALPFMEKKLLLSTSKTFEPVAAPLQRSDKSERPWGGPRTPLQHLFLALSSIPPGLGDDEELANLFQSTFEPFFKSRNTKARSELARELIQLLPRNCLSPYGPWVLAAEHMKSCAEKSPTASSASTTGCEKLLGPQYRDLVTLLERGIANHPSLPAGEWQCLFHLVSASVFQKFGDAGRALVIIEPLAKAMLDNLPSNSALPSVTAAQAMTMLLDVANLPRDRKALDTARLRLWGAPPAVTKAGSPDPFDNMYKLANHQMEALYNTYTTLGPLPEWKAFAESFCTFFEKCSAMAVVKTISKMQHGLCPWIQDEKDQLRLPDLVPLSRTLGRLWDRVCAELIACKRLEKEEFDQIEPLLIVALKSRQVSIVNKAAGAWNTLAREEEDVECSDTFRSIISSLGSKLDLIVPGLGPLSHADFDAQVSGIGDQDMESLVLSPATPYQGSKQVAAFASSASKQPITRKRQMRATSEAAQKSSKKPSTSRLRHDDSQIQFAVIAPSSPPLNDSQHLTDRQREVRERQLENAALYSDIRSDGAGRSDEAVAKTSNAAKKTDNGGGEGLLRDTTPARNTSFDDLVRSTPTPRRGQVLPVDDANDPPSSPPVPRPYPLLSEIQSRSKVSSSMDIWEFSSPTGSPMVKAQNVVNVGSASPTAKGEESPTRSLTRPRRQRRFAARGRDLMMIPSSIPDDDQSVTGARSKSSLIGLAVVDPPATPPRSNRVPTSGETWETKAGEDGFVDARSSPGRSSPEPLEPRAAEVHHEEGETNTSFALSDGAVNAAVDLVIELESRRYEPSASEGGDSPEKTRKPDTAHRKCITALPESPRGPTTRRESKRLASFAVQSTPAEATDKEAEGRARGKRKRGVAISPENRDKRRRSEEAGAVRGAHELSKSVSPAPWPRTSVQPKMGTGTRRSPRRRRGLTGATSVSEVTGSPEAEEAEEERAETGADGGDTDEELMSQLVTESFAASRQSESQESVKRVTRRAAKQGSLRLLVDPLDATTASPAEAEPRGGHADEGEEPCSILDTLRSGLEQLRKATLGRQAVYELEDVLMDLKRELYDAEKRGRRGK